MITTWIDKFNFLLSICPFPQFINARGIKNVVILVEEDTTVNIELLWYQFFRDKRVNLKCICSKKPFVVKNPMFAHFMKGYNTKDFNEKLISSGTLFLDLTTDNRNNPIKDLIVKNGGYYWIINKAVYQYYLVYIECIEAFQRFTAIHPKVPLIIYQRPIIAPEKYRNNHEKKLYEHNIVCANIQKMLKNNETLPLDNLFFDYTIDEIIATTQSVNSYIDNDGIRKFEDFHVGRVNYENGHRATAYQPKTSERTCYIIGGCAGLMTQIDEHTSASWLQKLFNENGQPIRVENYHYCVAGMHENLIDILFHLPVKDNDLVFFESNLSWCEEPYYNKIALKTYDLFFTPHKYGEVFSDCNNAGHYNGNGAHELADVLFEHLKKNDFFNSANNLEIYKNVIKDIAPISQYGTSKYTAVPEEEPSEYDIQLGEYKQSLLKYRPQNGAIVMNCNPFTYGHKYLIEYAASQVQHLYIFVVEEDRSIFPFKDRLFLVQEGTKDLINVTVLPSGKFIISQLTFKDYFNKSELQDMAIDPSYDVSLFASEIAPVLGISIRFAGEEPLDKVTQQYNDTMERILPQYGIEFRVIPRKESGNAPISASRLRKLLEDKDFSKIEPLVPRTTLDYLINRWGN